MKALVRSVFIRVVLVAAAVSVAYVAGVSQRVASTDDASAGGRGQRNGPPGANARNVPKLSRAQAMQQWSAGLQSAGQGINFDFIFGIINKTDPADVPALVEMIGNLPIKIIGQPPMTSEGDMALQQLFNLLRPGDAATVLALADNVTDPQKRSAIIRTLISALAWKDPALAMGMLTQLPPGPMAQAAFNETYQRLAENAKTADVAAAAATALPTGEERTQALLGLAKGWANSDAQADLDWVSSLPPSDSAPIKEALVDISENKQNAALAAQYVDLLSDATERNQVILDIADNWGNGVFGLGRDGDPADTLDWLNQVATGTTYDKAVSNIFSNVSKFDPATAAALLDQVDEPGVRETAITNVASNWGKTDPAAALDWVQTLPDSDGATRDTALVSIVTSWSKTDPQSAADFIQTSDDPSAFLSVAPTLVQALATSDPDAALAFAGSLPTGDVKNQALGNVLTALAKSNFSAAWDDALNLPAEDNPAAVMGSLVGALSVKNPAQAADLLEQFPAGAAQAAATSSVASVWVHESPAAFTAWLTDLPPGDQRDAATAQLIAADASTDPDEALAWANSLSDPQARAAQVQTVQLAAQINAMPAGDQRDAAIGQLLMTEASQSPEEAMLWANSISNPQTRNSQVQAIVNAWANTNPKAAANAVRGANIPEGQKSKLVQKINADHPGSGAMNLF